jgi:hypothetical protein
MAECDRCGHQARVGINDPGLPEGWGNAQLAESVNRSAIPPGSKSRRMEHQRGVDLCPACLQHMRMSLERL